METEDQYLVCNTISYFMIIEKTKSVNEECDRDRG